MGISVSSREKYHPSLDSNGNFLGGERDYEGRLSVIESVVDFSGKRVLDLGCSGGFFSFSIARKAKSITAIDADKHIIDRNRRIARSLDIGNIDFIENRITPKLLRELPNYDVVLFLSVFHHILVNSPTYDWTSEALNSEPNDVLSALRGVATTLVFEMGRTEEGFSWSKDLKQVVKEDQDHWIRKNVFANEFSKVKVLSGSARKRWLFRLMPALRNIPFQETLGRHLFKIMKVDRRDFRDIYIGIK